MFTSIAMGGMGIFSVAKPMMSEVFSGSLPTVVTSSFAATYLLCLSLANLGKFEDFLLLNIYGSIEDLHQIFRWPPRMGCDI